MLVCDSFLSVFIISQLPSCDCRDYRVHLAFNAPISVAAAASTTTPTIPFFSNSRQLFSTVQPTHTSRPLCHLLPKLPTSTSCRRLQCYRECR
ncbi:hypothetical protein ECG_09440 [Echinococcus granulosus]|nr:hypothetical protein ECG_09440 [Echinococcus granulosus]